MTDISPGLIDRIRVKVAAKKFHMSKGVSRMSVALDGNEDVGLYLQLGGKVGVKTRSKPAGQKQWLLEGVKAYDFCQALVEAQALDWYKANKVFPTWKRPE